MKRLLSLVVVLGLTSSCYVGETDDALLIEGFKALQTDPTKDVCDATLPIYDHYPPITTAQLKTDFTSGVSESLTYLFFSAAAASPTLGFGSDNLQGTHTNDFLADSVVFEYSSDNISLPTEKSSVSIRITEGEDSLGSGTGACAQAPIMGSGAQQTLGNLSLSAPLNLSVRIHLEGSYVNGKLGRTASVILPVTVYP